jgi:hypothetical protein
MPTALRILFWILGIACAGALGYFAYAHMAAPSPQAAAVASSQVPAQEAPQPGFAAAAPADASVVSAGPRTALAGAKEYRNAAYHLSLFYPENLALKAYDEGGGAATITFQNTTTAEGFQIFIVPYAQSQISRERFLQDEPSGAMENPLNVTIAGAPATSFYGSNALLGETAEIWLMRGGYLYEVTAPKPEAAWLSQIMQTWQFI